MKLAVIDLGTNSIRTMIADVQPDGRFEIVDDARELIRLGEGENAESGLSAKAMSTALLALERARAQCDAQHVEQIIAVATSATREAKNGREFLQQARQRTGIPIQVLPAEEEARLIYVAARASVTLGQRRALFVDIGGGSAEFIIGDRRTMEWATSVQLGVLRLVNEFHFSDRLTADQVGAVRSHIAETLAPILPRIRALGFEGVVATSGTNLMLAALALDESEALNNQAVPIDRLREVCAWLVGSSREEREHHPSIPPGRADSVVMGALLWEYLLDELQISEVIVCLAALRHGVLLDYLQRHFG